MKILVLYRARRGEEIEIVIDADLTTPTETEEMVKQHLGWDFIHAGYQLINAREAGEDAPLGIVPDPIHPQT